MSYKIVAYGPRKSCLTWARDQISLEAKGHKPFIAQGELDTIVDVANKCNELIAQLPKGQG